MLAEGHHLLPEPLIKQESYRAYGNLFLEKKNPRALKAPVERAALKGLPAEIAAPLDKEQEEMTPKPLTTAEEKDQRERGMPNHLTQLINIEVRVLRRRTSIICH